MEALLNNFVSSKDLINWQTQMSNTAHTREVADLKAAGLNPILSAHTNGASTPSGASDDLSTLLNAMASSVENSGKALKSMAEKDKAEQVYKDTAKIAEEIGSAFGLRWLVKAGTSAQQMVADYVENHPETFDEKWMHHHLGARNDTPELYQSEKDYRESKNKEAWNRFKNWFYKKPSAKAVYIEGGT